MNDDETTYHNTETIFDIVGMNGYHPRKIQIGVGDDGGCTLYIERQDGSGVAIDVDNQTFLSLEKTFILTEIDEE